MKTRSLLTIYGEPKNSKKKSSQSCTRSWPNRRREHSSARIVGWMDDDDDEANLSSRHRRLKAILPLTSRKSTQSLLFEIKSSHLVLSPHYISRSHNNTIICIRSSQEPRTWRWIFFLSLIRSTIDLFSFEFPSYIEHQRACCANSS